VRKELVRLLAGSRREPGTPAPTPEQIQQSLRELRFAGVMVTYRPEPFSGRLVLLRTKLLDRDYPTDRTAGWSKLAAQMEVYDLPADHETCRTEQLGVVAEHIGNCLRAYRADAHGKSTHDR
jgi:thioesterase domain-containing protein